MNESSEFAIRFLDYSGNGEETIVSEKSKQAY